MSAPHIAVVGSYATGLTMKVARIPSAGETLLGTGYRVDYGGKGSNQAVGCARLGAHVDFIAKIGKDAFGDMALRLYSDEGIAVEYVQQVSEAPTGVGFIVVEKSSGQNCIVLDPGANELLTAADVSASDAALRSATVVLAQLEISVDAAKAAMASGRRTGAATILNPAPVRPLPASLLSLIDVLTPNETEARVLAGRASDSAIEPELLGQELIRLGVRQVVMTLGEKGALLITGASSTLIPTVQVRPVDTTGAGDAFNAGLATALAHGTSLEQAVRFAVMVGAIAVTKEGVIPSLPRREEVLQFYRQHGAEAPAWLNAAKRTQ